jgi:Two component regulator propeller
LSFCQKYGLERWHEVAPQVAVSITHLEAAAAWLTVTTTFDSFYESAIRKDEINVASKLRIAMSRWPKSFFGLASGVFGSLALFALPVFGLDPAKKLDQYPHRIWTIQDGLPTDGFHSILQTRDGYLWIGTEGGVVRFDGVKFQVFDKTSRHLPGNYVSCLLEDSKGTLWIGTAGGLARYQAGRFQTMGKEAGLDGAYIYGLAEDTEGAIWITADYKLYRYAGNSFTYFDPRKDNPDYGRVAYIKKKNRTGGRSIVLALKKEKMLAGGEIGREPPRIGPSRIQALASHLELQLSVGERSQGTGQ